LITLVGPVLGDVGEPQLVGSDGTEGSADQVVVQGFSRPGAPSFLASQDQEDAVDAAQAVDAVLARGDAVLCGDFVGDEPVAEHRIVGADVAGGVDQVRVGPVPVADGASPPLVEGLGGKPSTRQVTLTGIPSKARSRTSG
jgi:hypothetical protein